MLTGRKAFLDEDNRLQSSALRLGHMIDDAW
jgi:hypothetical protein